TEPGGEREEENRREPRVDPAARLEDEGVRDADLEKAAEAEPPRLASRQAPGAGPQGERRQDRAGDRHADRGEVERRQIPQPDLDDEPRGAPDRAAEGVDGEAPPRERAHPARDRAGRSVTSATPERIRTPPAAARAP